ncbi:leucine-rich repeat domain-containing protein, partial [Flavobacterium sp. 9AF]|uniref:leucine-rich repeat domain-containing protein n=1 Tax=Flavobacterium sp. 9AF TaxID=2653142 RepID=UPI00351AE280
MKKIYFLLLVLFGLNVQAQIINFPDANFKAKLLSASSSNQIASTEVPNVYGNVTTYTTIDTNNNGEIEESEAALITYLNVQQSNIADLTGINYFVNLLSLNCIINQLIAVDVTQNINLQRLRLDLNDLISLDVSQNLYLKKLSIPYNDISTLDLTQNLYLESLDCRNNDLVNLNLTQNPYLNDLLCLSNQLTYLDVTQNLLLLSLQCGLNQLSSLNVTQNTLLETLNFQYNQLTDIDISQNYNLIRLFCRNNQLTNLDITHLPQLRTLDCNNNQLTTLLIKNNNPLWINNIGDTNGVGLQFSNNFNLQYICADEEDLQMVEQKVLNYGYTNCHVNSYCSFVPGGDYFSIEGQTIYDYNSNGCDLNDLNYSNLRFSITDGTNSGHLISNQSGNYFIPVQAGSHTITPILENPTYFNISPTSLTVDFPAQANPFTQDFCVTANGIHSDVEIVVLPIISARPGFDAKYKISYRNKGNQVENGSVSLTFDDAILDYLSSNPVFNSAATNSYTWNYSNLQPFETREIEIIFNVNSPTETPSVNIDDVLNYTAVISTANTDETPDDNEFTLHQTVVGSYDPNDKTCLEGETVGPDMIGEYVHYLIRFENTGTYPAENIVVKDMIDVTKFDIATLVPLKGSHDFYTRI